MNGKVYRAFDQNLGNQMLGVHARMGAVIIANKNKFYDNPGDA